MLRRSKYLVVVKPKNVSVVFEMALLLFCLYYLVFLISYIVVIYNFFSFQNINV